MLKECSSQPVTKGKFITVEGGEGAGKSTNIDFIKAYLESKGVDLVCTREPGGTLYAEKIRELLLSHQPEPLDSNAELLLIFAARAQHLSEHILPALERGQWVLCDRFTDATYAYQGAGRGLGHEAVSVLESFVQGDMRPDMTLILDVPVELGMSRVQKRGELDRFETEQRSFFETVRQSYLDMAAQSPQRYSVIDTSHPLDQVQQSISDVLNPLLLVG